MSSDYLPNLTAAAAITAAAARRKPAGPAQLAARLDPKFVVTPTIRLLDDIAKRSVEQPSQRDIATMAPRTGKSRLLAIWTPV